jgi:hypothetical protein
LQESFSDAPQIPVQHPDSVLALSARGFEHSAADLLRSGWSTFKCKQCGKDFPSGKQ